MKVLVLDDEEPLAELLAGRLREAGHQVRTAYSAARALEALAAQPVDLVLSDLMLPDANGIELMPRLVERSPAAKVVMMTGTGSTAVAVKAMKAGAEDYLEKPFDLEELLVLVEKLDRHHGVELELDSLRRTRVDEASQDLGVTILPGMRRVYGELETASAQGHLSVLLLGETGTGKEHAARLLHRLSPRFAKPFIEVNCAALPETLVEAELFGSEAGAYTDAKRRRVGLFEAAQGGTLFLDEIGELPLAAQAKLLKVLEDRELRRVGGSETLRLDLRVVAATNRDLQAESKAGRFRPDLYWRLALFPVRLPPLREHPEDIPALAAFLFQRACQEFGRRLQPLKPGQLAALAARDWPGNVRELRNTIDASVLRARGDVAALDGAGDSGPVAAAVGGALPPMRQAVDEAVHRVKLDLLQRALAEAKGNKMQAARLLEVDGKTIHNLI
ncbi:MAG TPA: sigma-54 dependent transcriptional regulator, partial [bacterium]|nr:sigma-54 dependent transcriptional regulator [bacterium]